MKSVTLGPFYFVATQSQAQTIGCGCHDQTLVIREGRKVDNKKKITNKERKNGKIGSLYEPNCFDRKESRINH